LNGERSPPEQPTEGATKRGQPVQVGSYQVAELGEGRQLVGLQLDQVEELALDCDLAGDHWPGFPEPGSGGRAEQPALKCCSELKRSRRSAPARP
jgi:hypothetical protein